MANQKISALTELTTPSSGDLIPIVSSSQTKNISYGNLVENSTIGLSGLLKPQINAVAVTAANNDLRIRDITGYFGDTGVLQASISGLNIGAKSFNTVTSSTNGEAFAGGNYTGSVHQDLGTDSIDIQAGVRGGARIAKGTQSIAIGSVTLVHGNKSTSIGRENQLYSRNSHLLGELNLVSSAAVESSVVGRNCKISGAYSVAHGNNIDVSSNSSSSVSFGRNLVVTDNADGSVAVGNNINMSGANSMAMGFGIDVSGDNSAGLGRNVLVYANGVSEFGGWYESGNRGASVRLQNVGLPANPSGFVSISLANGSLAPLDGGANHGSEDVDSLPREMFSIRRDGDEVLADLNISGSVKTVSFGDATSSNRTSIGSAVQNVRGDSVTINSMRQVTSAFYSGISASGLVDANTFYAIVG